ncbi:MAG: phosphopentomutase [Clostridiales bacterium]|nr:phosphopentomutase [Clostridiales bacterium]
MAKRVFLIVLDSFGLGGAPDEAAFKDEGSNTLAAVLSDSNRPFPGLSKMGLLNIDGLDDERILSWKDAQETIPSPVGYYGRLRELSAGKDSTIGHWEMAGVCSSSPLPTYPDGFPEHILDKIREVSGRGILCNKPYSGTDVIRDFGEQHMKTGDLIVYTSADSVLQIATHEDVVPLDELYSICSSCREFMTGADGVGRVIARPFVGSAEEGFTRTSNRKDFSLPAPSATMLDILKAQDLDVISIGKIKDLYAHRGLTEEIATSDNTDGIRRLKDMLDCDFHGLCFLNLVDFDMKYGHRNDIKGYAEAMHEFDDALEQILPLLEKDDLLIITADHGCDPSTPSTDHSRECVPLLIYGEGYDVPHNMGEIAGFNIISSIVYTALLARSFAPSVPHLPHELNENDLMSYVDMTNLKTTAKTSDIEALVDDAILKGAASVCIQPCFVKDAARRAKGRINICTVISFPNGYSTTAVKKYEALDAISNGATEIDMVININFIKSRRFDEAALEIGIIADAVHKKGAILKVIIETCELTDTEKKMLCNIVTVQGADFIKTSTGFGSSGATVDDVRLMRHFSGSTVEVKAAGGIRSEDAAKSMIEAGATRIGASSLG